MKESRERLRASEERFPRLASVLEDVIWEYDVVSKSVWRNDVFFNRMGMDRNDPSASSFEAWFGRIHPDDRPRVLRSFDDALAGNHDAWVCEYRLRLADGRYAHTLDRGTISRHADGSAQRMFGIAIDITERKTNEERLRLCEAQLSQAQRIAHFGSWERDVQRDDLIWSDEMYRIYGLEIGTPVTFATVLERVHPDDRAALNDKVRRSIEEGIVVRAEYRIRNGAGQLRRLHAVGEVEFDAAGRPARIMGTTQDITDWNDAQEALRSTEAKYKRLVENIPDIAWTSDENGVTTYISPAVERVIGFTAEEVCANHLAIWPGRVHPDDRQQLKESYAALFRGRPYDVEYRFQRKDGVWIWLHDRAITHYSSGGRNFVDGIFADITEKKNADEALRASERRYRDVVAYSPLGICQATPDGEYLMVNNALAAMLGFDSAEELKAQSVIDHFVDPDDQRRLVDTVTLRGVVKNYQTRFRRKDGSILWAELDAHAVRDEQGTVLFVESFLQDISERKRHECERETLTRDLQLFLESAYEGIVVHDAEGRCLRVNQSACKMLGYPAEELVGRSLHELIHHKTASGDPYPRENCPVRLALTGLRADVDEVFWRSDGSSFPVEMAYAPIVEDGIIRGSIVTFRDVSEKRLLQKELEQATRLASLGRVAATMAHEFNNVLMGILPFAEVLAKRASNDDLIQRAALQIKSSIARGKRVTGEVLRFTKPSPPVLNPIAFTPWLQNVINEARSILPESISLVAEAPEEPVELLGDGSQLHQILINLIVNARDAMPNGGVLSIRACRPSRGVSFPFGVVPNPERYLHLSVTDNGCGIAPENLTHVFEPLFTTKSNGTGLGLAVAHQATKLHGGEIFVESELGRGTSFHLFFPLCDQVAG